MLMKKLFSISSLLFSLFLASCEEKVSATEENVYNSYFVQYEPEEKKMYVGTVTGLSSCKYIVSDYYAKRRKFIKGSWDYMCCLKTARSNCSEKHRYKGDGH